MKLGDLTSTSRDLRLYHAEIVARCAVTFAAMALCHFGYAPLWALVLVNLAVYPGIYLRIHDVGHATSPERFGLSARFVPVSNPIWGGTRVFSEIHSYHHAYLGTDKDPWLPYYTGHPLRALFFNFIELEYSLMQFVRRRGIDRELVRNGVFNLAGLAVGLALFQWTYVVHLVSQRLVHMLGIFFFNFYTHRATFSASAPIGVWSREEDLGRALPLLRFIWGGATIEGLIHHNRHHCLGQVHIPVQNYKHLKDTGVISRLNADWPLLQVKMLGDSPSLDGVRDLPAEASVH